jgi:hypothetical protein
MTFADDVKMSNGVLLVARGYEITAGFLQRARSYPSGSIREPLRVIVPQRRKIGLVSVASAPLSKETSS